MDIVDNIVDEILNCCLGKLGENEWFLSEDDFKFSFAQAATEKGSTNVILEYPIMTSELYKNKTGVKDTFVEYYTAHPGNTTKKPKQRYNENRSFIDVYFEYNGEKHFIELKYKTRNEIVTRHGMKFSLKDQSAQDLGSYSIYEDIERMEAIMSSIKGCKGHVIVLTNDSNYLTRPREGTQRYLVRLNDVSRKGTIRYHENNGKNSRRNLIIKYRYSTWNETDRGIEGSNFHKMVIHCKGQMKKTNNNRKLKEEKMKRSLVNHTIGYGLKSR